MYLKKSFNKKTGRTQLAIVHGFYDPIKKTSRSKTIKNIGYLDVLEKEYDDPIAHFTEMAKQMDKEFRENEEINFSFSSTSKMSLDTKPINLGYLPLSKIFNELKINKFFDKYQRNKKISYKLSKVMELLVYSRILFPSSKKKLMITRIVSLKNSIFL